MSKALVHFGHAPRTVAEDSGGPYEVSLLKKLPHYQSDTGKVSVVEHEWVYNTIIVTSTPGFAVYEALYEYFVWRLTQKWQTRGCPLSPRELTLVDLFARDLAESAMRRFGTESQMISALITPWEPDLFTVGFERSL